MKNNRAEHRSDGVTVLKLKCGRVTHLCFVDTSDYFLVQNYHWRATKFPNSRTIYATASLLDGMLYMHRILISDAEKVDHRDLNGLNNRRSNLRSATQSQQMANTEKRAQRKGIEPTSRYKGVHFDKTRGKYRAKICVFGKPIHLGRFDSETEAAGAYNEAAKKHFGKFARLNLLQKAA